MAETQVYAMEQKDNFIMLPKVDFCFKELMDDEEVRKGFLSALLEKNPDEIKATELLPTILKKHYSDDKWGILDVRVKMIDGSQVDIEIQLTDYHDWTERSLFYLCKMFCEQIKEGDVYKDLKKCIHVGILNFDLFESGNYYSKFHLWEDDRDEMYSDRLEIHILELKKVWNPELPESELLNWARFLSGETKEDLADVAEKNSYIQKAYERVLDISVDEEKRWEYEARMKALRDKTSIQKYAAKAREEAAKAQEEAAKAREEVTKAQEEAAKIREEAVKVRVNQICKKIRKGKNIEVIADELEETVETIRPICEVAKKYAPDYDVEAIYKEVLNN